MVSRSIKKTSPVFFLPDNKRLVSLDIFLDIGS